MPKKSILSKSSTKSKSACFGRKRKSKKHVKKVILPVGSVRIEMLVADYSKRRISKKLKWVSVPNVDNYRNGLIVDWLNKLQKIKAIKMILIHGMQNCIRVSYAGKIPSWFSHKIVSSTPEHRINEYFIKAKRVLTCMNMRDASADPNNDWSKKGAGFLITSETANTKHFKFKEFSVLCQQCRYNGPEPMTAYQIIDMIDNTQDTFKSENVGAKWAGRNLLCSEIAETMKTYIHLVLTGTNVDSLLARCGYLTFRGVQENRQAVAAAVNGSQQSAVANAAALQQELAETKKARDGFKSERDAAIAKNIENKAMVEQLTAQSTKFEKEIKRLAAAQEAQVSAQGSAGQPRSKSAQRQTQPASSKQGPTSAEKRAKDLADAAAQETAKRAAAQGKPKSSMRNIVGAVFNGMTGAMSGRRTSAGTPPGSATSLQGGTPPQSSSSESSAGIRMSGATGASSAIDNNSPVGDRNASTGSTGSTGSTDPNAMMTGDQLNQSERTTAAGVSDILNLQNPPGNRMNTPGTTKYGRSLASMTGFVRPFSMSPNEAYTGMTRSMYNSHVNSRTGLPVGLRNTNLAQANNYYGSYRLGEAQFGRNLSTPRKAPKKASKKVTKKSPKKVTKKKAAKDSGFGRPFFF